MSGRRYKIIRFCRVIWGIVCSAFLLACTILYHIKCNQNSISRDVAKNMYVDNLVSGVSDDKEAKEYYKQSKALFNSASMNL